MTAARWQIGRLAARYVVARGHPDPAALAARLDAAAHRLPGHIAAAAAPHASETADAVWLLRRLEVDVALDAAADPDALAAAWGRAIAGATWRRLDAGADGVVMFPDRAAYLASFLRDVAGGDASSLWYYGAFDGLRALPIAATLRTALLADADQGRRALLLLTPWEAAGVLAALGANEARRVLDGLAGAGQDSLPDPLAILAAWQEAPGFGVCPDRLALACWLAILRHAGDSGVGSAGLSRALAELWLTLLRGAAGVAASLCSGDLPALCRAVGPAGAERLAPLLQLSEAFRHRLASAPDSADANSASAARDTPFGGLFLLLPHLAEPPLDALDRLEAPAPSLLRFLVLASCAGEEAAMAVFLDQVWRDLFAVPGGFLLRDLAAWSATLPDDALGPPGAGSPSDAPHPVSRLAVPLAAAADAVLSRFARRLPGFSQSSPDYLRRNFLACRARVTFAPDVITAELGRPPLDLVLGMTGMARARLDLPWLDARPLELRTGA
jgi:hypothetical protein